MAFTALVDAIVKNIRDPDNHCHSSLIHTLKKEIVNDLTNAYVQSGPLVNKYAALYVESKSFLDFMLRFCDLTPPKPSYVDSSPLQCKIDELEKSLKECREQQRQPSQFQPSPKQTPSDDSRLQELQESLAESQKEIDSLKKALKDCNEKKDKLVEDLRAALDYKALYDKELNDTCLLKAQELQKCERDRDKCFDTTERLKEELLDLQTELDLCREEIKETKCSVCQNGSASKKDDSDENQMAVDDFNETIDFATGKKCSAAEYLKNISESVLSAEEHCKAYLKELNESNKKEIQAICQQNQEDREAFELKLVESAKPFDFEDLNKKLEEVFTRTLQITKLSDAIEYIKKMETTFTAPQILTYNPEDLNRVLEESKNILGNIKTRQDALEAAPKTVAIEFPQQQMKQLESYINKFDESLQSYLKAFKDDVLANQPMYNLPQFNETLQNAAEFVKQITEAPQPSGLFSHPAIEGSPQWPKLMPAQQLQALTDSVSQVEAQFKQHVEAFQKEALAKITFDPTALNDVLKNASEVLNQIKTTQADMKQSHGKLAELMPSAEHLAIEYPRQLENVQKTISNFEKAVKNQLVEYNNNAGDLILQSIPNETKKVIKELKIEEYFENAIESMRKLPWHDRQDVMTDFFDAAQKFVSMMPSIESARDDLKRPALAYNDVPMITTGNEDAAPSIGSTRYQENVSGELVLLRTERDEYEKEILKLKSNACSCQKLREHFVTIHKFDPERWDIRVMDDFKTISINIEKLNKLIKQYDIPFMTVEIDRLADTIETAFDYIKKPRGPVDYTYTEDVEELKRYAKKPFSKPEEFFGYLKNMINYVNEHVKKDHEKEAIKTSLQNTVSDLQRRLGLAIKSKNQLEEELKELKPGDLQSQAKNSKSDQKSTLKKLYRKYDLDPPKKKHSVDDFISKLYISKFQSYEDLEKRCEIIKNKLNIILEPVGNLKWIGFEEKVLRVVFDRKRARHFHDNGDEIREMGSKRSRVMVYEYEIQALKDEQIINDLGNLLTAMYVQYFRLLWDSKYRKIEPMPQNLQDDLNNKLIALVRLTDDEEKPASYYFKSLKNYVHYDLKLYNGENPYAFQYEKDTNKQMEAFLKTAIDQTEKYLTRLDDKGMIKQPSAVQIEDSDVLMNELDATTA